MPPGLPYHSPFQPTSPVRETTCFCTPHFSQDIYFNPRPPCGRRLLFIGHRSAEVSISTHVPRAGDDSALHHAIYVRPISTHVPRAGDDRISSSSATAATSFQPTSPVRETTRLSGNAFPRPSISTHVPRAGDDASPPFLFHSRPYFNPRPPCGRRRIERGFPQDRKLFQPTSPVRETTQPKQAAKVAVGISTHVPRAGDDHPERHLIPCRFISTHVPRAGDDKD